MKCPICNTKRATGTHYIKPRDDDGSDNHRSKVTLCRPCHDIVEEVCDRTGKELSPQLIDLIKLEYNFPDGDTDWDVARSVFATTSYRLRRKRKFAREKHAKTEVPDGVALKCPHCGKWHYPEKNGRVICPVLKAHPVYVNEADVFHSNIMGKIKRVRESLE